MSDQLKKIFVLTNDSKLKIGIVIVLFIITSVIDIFGLATLGLFISFLISNQNIGNNYFINILLGYYNFEKNEVIIYLSFSLIFIFLIKTFFSLIIQHFIISFSNIKMADLRIQLLNSYKEMTYSNYIKRNTSEFISTVSQHIKNYGALLQATLQSISDFFILLFVAIFLIIIDWKIFLLSLILIILFILLYKKFYLNNSYYFGKIVNQGYKKLYQNINELFIGFKEIKILNKFDSFENNIEDASTKIVKAEIKRTFIETAPRYILELLIVIVSLTLVLFSLFIDGNLEDSLSSISFFIAAFLRITPMAYQSTRYISIFKYSKNSIDILYDDFFKFNQKNNIKISNKYLSFENINIKNLSFSYPNSSHYVFNNLNLILKKGQALGIIGPSGSGKTTLIDIIIGLLPYNIGSIMIDNVELNKIKNIQEWRNLFYYMPQEIFIINDSLKKNIALGIAEKDIDENKINEAIKKANLESFKKKFKDGINTQIGERGINISGGQKQRIAIARSFYFDKEIIIFDEGTSSLDMQTEDKIIEEIYQLKKHKTLIIISHNNNTIKNCDFVCDINNFK